MAFDVRRVARQLEWRPSGVRLPDGRLVSREDAARALEGWLYERCFIAWSAPTGRFSDSVGGAPHFTAALLEAVGRATWSAPGFRVLTRSPEGVFVSNDAIRLFVQPTDLTPGHARQGGPVRVRLPCAREAAMPGFFCFTSRAGGLDHERPHLKVYLNCTPAFAVRLVRWLFAEPSLGHARFDGKVVNDPEAFGRRDTALLYVEPGALPTVLASVRRLHRTQPRGLRAATPPFLLQLGPGVGVAESPAGDESFGAHRSRLVAEGLLRHLEAPDGSAVTAVRAAFASNGLDLDRPWLGRLPARWVTLAERAWQRPSRRRQVRGREPFEPAL